jgi:2-polyprenyl-3-methyl-5-hydroxy-6-metoxy-1,4-benzoquinol methylase
MTSNATDFHDQNAQAFVDQYCTDLDFSTRLAVWKAILNHHAPRSGLAVDLGCGSGPLSFALADHGLKVLGVDGSAEMVRRSEEERKRRGLTNVSFLRLDLPARLPGAPFQIVTASSLLEYLPDNAIVDQWIAELVAPGGILVLSLPNRRSIYRRWESLKFRLTGRPAYLSHVKRCRRRRKPQRGLLSLA